MNVNSHDEVTCSRPVKQLFHLQTEVETSNGSNSYGPFKFVVNRDHGTEGLAQHFLALRRIGRLTLLRQRRRGMFELDHR